MNTTDNNTTSTPAQSVACNCGCGEVVKNAYRPGHDARHVSILVSNWIRAYEVSEGAATHEVDDAMRRLPSAALKAKYLNAQQKAEAKVEAKRNREQRRAEAKAAKLAATKGAGSEDRARDEHEASLSAKVAQEEAEYQAQVAPVIEADGGEIKVGRWTYPTGSKRGDDTQYRNTKRDGSGEWVEVA